MNISSKDKKGGKLRKMGDLRVRTNKTPTCWDLYLFSVQFGSFYKKTAVSNGPAKKNLSISTEHNTSKIKNRTKSELK